MEEKGWFYTWIYQGEIKCKRCEHYDYKNWKWSSEIKFYNAKVNDYEHVNVAKCLLQNRTWEEDDYHCDQFYPAKRFWRRE